MSKGERTKAEIVQIGLQVWRETPNRVNASHIASLVGITHAAVIYHWGTAAQLRMAIAEHAVKVRDPVIVPMLITSGHPAVAHMSESEKMEFLANACRG